MPCDPSHRVLSAWNDFEQVIFTLVWNRGVKGQSSLIDFIPVSSRKYAFHGELASFPGLPRFLFFGLRSEPLARFYRGLLKIDLLRVRSGDSVFICIPRIPRDNKVCHTHANP